MRSLSSILLLTLLGISVCFAQAKRKPKLKPAEPKKVETQNQLQKLEVNALEQEIFNEINLLRADPASFIKYLEAQKITFEGNNFVNSKGSVFTTIEGIAAVNEAINFLKKQKPMGLLSFSDGLNRAANQHLNDMIKKDFFAHKGSDGSFSDVRANRFGSWAGSIKENLAAGTENGREIVLQWIVDDGFPSRGHRNNLLEPNFRKVGISFGKTPTNGYVTVAVFANSFYEKGGSFKKF
jgi:Cysteine-rich secretory protein family